MTSYVEAVPAKTAEVRKGVNSEEVKSENKSFVVYLLKQLRPGMSLSKIVLPAFILEPRSMLEKLSDFMTHGDLLLQVPKQESAMDRMLALLKFYLSGFYIKPKGVKKPFNPILGETFRCMWDHGDSRTFYVAEQCSHHPPISSFYIQNRKAGVVVNGSIEFVSQFMGTYGAAVLKGKCVITLIDHEEDWEFTFPDVHSKGFIVGPLVMEMCGKVHVQCLKHNLKATLDFKSKPMFGGEYNVVSGSVAEGNDTKYTLVGKWDDVVYVKEGKKVEKKVDKKNPGEIFWTPDGKISEALYKPTRSEMTDFESNKLWQATADFLAADNVQEATKEKTILEEAQRERKREADARGETHEPKWFQRNVEADASSESKDSKLFTYRWINTSKWNAAVEDFEYEQDGRILSGKDGVGSKNAIVADVADAAAVSSAVTKRGSEEKKPRRSAQ